MRRVFLCMFMFQYSPRNTVNNATSFYKPSGPMLFCLDNHDNIHEILDSLILHYCGRNVWNSFEKVLDGDGVNKK